MPGNKVVDMHTSLDDSDERPDRDEARPVAPAVPFQPFKLHKPGQGKYVRWCSAVGAALIALGAAWFVNERLSVYFGPGSAVRYVVPVLVLCALAYLAFWFTGSSRYWVDFMIATESEMKKVNWSSRREVIAATKVVIVTLLALAVILFVVDLLSIVVFSGMGVLRVDILSRLFKSPT